MRIFDTYVQKIKYNVLKEVAKLAFEDKLTTQNAMQIGEELFPDGTTTTLRCCIYKARAIINQRVVLAMGGNKEDKNVVEVLSIACDECPVDGIQVTDSCRGCLARRCMDKCPKDAITIINHKAHIDKSKCIECGKCMEACPYSAIKRNARPCVKACKPKAIDIDIKTQKAVIHEDKCISCGACVYQCPFGAISDKSFITEAIKLIKESKNNEKYKVYAVVAPSVASQYSDIKTEQIVEAIKMLGFYEVVEAAWGADVTAYLESKELEEKKFLTSSCCPAFVSFIKKNFPKLKDNISTNLSPMAQIAKWLKVTEPDCKVVFIGPCIAKKAETLYTKSAEFVDCTITFEELQALVDAKDIDMASLKGMNFDKASYFGRVFARCGGVAQAVEQALKERGVSEEAFKLNAISCDGIANCKTELMKAAKGVSKYNFIEGMACENGCIGGPACVTHGAKIFEKVDEYGRASSESSIMSSIAALEVDKWAEE